MPRYEVKQISFNWYGIYGNVMHEYVMESTSVGIDLLAQLFC